MSLIIFAFLLQWPTLITAAMAPVLVLVYSRLARREERKMLEVHGAAYERYMSATGRFFPSLAGLRRIQTGGGTYGCEEKDFPAEHTHEDVS